MRNMITLPDGSKVWPKHPRWKHEDMWLGIPREKAQRTNRSKLARGKNRLRFNGLYATDRAAMVKELDL